MSHLVAYVDGGSLGNPGPAGIGVVIQDAEGQKVRIAKWIGRQDNNVAEYLALLEALQYAVALKARAIHVYSDSEVVVLQMTGKYRCRSPRLYSLHWTCRKLTRALEFSISHVPRSRNAEARIWPICLRRWIRSPPLSLPPPSSIPDRALARAIILNFCYSTEEGTLDRVPQGPRIGHGALHLAPRLPKRCGRRCGWPAGRRPPCRRPHFLRRVRSRKGPRLLSPRAHRDAGQSRGHLHLCSPSA